MIAGKMIPLRARWYEMEMLEEQCPTLGLDGGELEE